MADQLGHVSFPGVNQVRSCTYTRGLGTLPDVFHMRIVPQTGAILSSGTVAMSFHGTGVSFPNCVVDRASMNLTQRLQVVTIKIFDRRIHWKYKVVNGYYNARFADGTIQSGTEQTPQQLAEKLLDAMGEFGYDVSALPNTDNPTVDWDYANAGNELSKLCERRGCVISLDLDNRVRIYQAGSGASNPTADIVSISFGVNPPEPPSQILVIGNYTLVQSKLLLEAVGLDTDGTIKLIDDLSYKPAAGWDDETPKMTKTRAQARALLLQGEEEVLYELAKKSVWKWYRIKSQSDGSLDIPGYNGDSTGLWQILPVRNRKVDTTPDIDGIERPQTATVQGVHFTHDIQGNTAAKEVVVTPFSIDKELGIVKFSEPVYRKSTIADFIGEGKLFPATLYLETSYYVQHSDTRRFERYERGLTLGPGNGTQIIRRNDIYQIVIGEYKTDDPTVLENVTTNTQAADAEAEANLTAAAANYPTAKTINVNYNGIIRISTSGVTRQVTWVMDMQRGFNTLAFMNNEAQVGVLSGFERRRIEHLRDEQHRSDRIGDVRWENH